MAKAKQHSFKNWCKRCKFHDSNPSECIGCLVATMGNLALDQPPGFVKVVNE